MKENQKLITYIILAHHKPELLFKLIEKLNHDKVNFLIHWDKNSKCDFKKVQQFCSSYKNCKVYCKYPVQWMGFSIIKSTLLLMRESIKHSYSKYYVLMSGQDYPIKPLNTILKFFEDNNRNFISLNYLSDLGKSFRDKVDYYHFLDFPLWNPKSKHRNFFFYKIYFSLFVKRIQKLFPKRRMYKNFIPYFGSQWFALTYETVRDILKFVDENPGYSKFMKYVESPDEVFFHTIIGNTNHLRSNVMEIEDFDKWSELPNKVPPFVYKWGSLRYMDWESPNREKPAVLDMRDFDNLKKSHLLFCRKIDERSNELINCLDVFLETNN
jgi:hypothetical protein